MPTELVVHTYNKHPSKEQLNRLESGKDQIVSIVKTNDNEFKVTVREHYDFKEPECGMW